MDIIKGSPVLQVQNINVTYGNFKAVRDVSFDVKAGEIFGLLGPNGAGKTSTLSAVEGLVKYDAGTITIAGFDNRKEPLNARANMGVQLQSTSFQTELKVQEILKLYSGICGVDLNKQRLQQLLADIGLEDSAHKKYGELSGGQQQRVSLAIATIHEPVLIMLDEPTTGLDPQSRRQLWERIEGMREKGHGVLLTTHSMEEAEAVCDRIAIIDHGRVIAIETPEIMIEKHKGDAEVIAASRKGKVTLEDVFIGLTGKALRN